jgi:hypothetical protein
MRLLAGGTIGIVLYYLWKLRSTAKPENGEGPSSEFTP